MEKSRRKKREKMRNKIARDIIGGTLSATAWTFDFLANMGVLTIEVFLKPSVYADLPNISFADFAEQKQKKKVALKEPVIRQSIRRLKKSGFVAERKGKYSLTGKGKELMSYITGRKKAMSVQWDKKFRVVVFDIPEKKRKIRDWLRQELLLLNYKKLQESVFIGKYPLPVDLIKSIKSNEIENCLNYLLVEKVYENVI